MDSYTCDLLSLNLQIGLTLIQFHNIKFTMMAMNIIAFTIFALGIYKNMFFAVIQLLLRICFSILIILSIGDNIDTDGLISIINNLYLITRSYFMSE
jgi:hypothetical protein